MSIFPKDFVLSQTLSPYINVTCCNFSNLLKYVKSWHMYKYSSGESREQKRTYKRVLLGPHSLMAGLRILIQFLEEKSH